MKYNSDVDLKMKLFFFTLLVKAQTPALWLDIIFFMMEQYPLKSSLCGVIYFFC
jgi:hypothetical protein